MYPTKDIPGRVSQGTTYTGSPETVRTACTMGVSMAPRTVSKRSNDYWCDAGLARVDLLGGSGGVDDKHGVVRPWCSVTSVQARIKRALPQRPTSTQGSSCPRIPPQYGNERRQPGNGAACGPSDVTSAEAAPTEWERGIRLTGR